MSTPRTNDHYYGLYIDGRSRKKCSFERAQYILLIVCHYIQIDITNQIYSFNLDMEKVSLSSNPTLIIARPRALQTLCPMHKMRVQPQGSNSARLCHHDLGHSGPRGQMANVQKRLHSSP